MSHNHHMHGLGALALISAIAFAFGVRTAQYVVGVVLLAGLGFFAYVMFRIVMGTI